jgi:thiamine kinase-like enzyme
MYVEQYLAKERHQEQIRRAEEERVAHQLTELHKLERRQARAERQLLQAWARVEQIRAVISAG